MSIIITYVNNNFLLCFWFGMSLPLWSSLLREKRVRESERVRERDF
jgi:hypothetical protein